MKLSPTETRIWRAIGHLEAETGRAPAWRAVVSELRYRTPGSIGQYVDELRYKGLLQAGDWDHHLGLRIASGVTVLSDGSVLRGPWDPFDRV